MKKCNLLVITVMLLAASAGLGFADETSCSPPFEIELPLVRLPDLTVVSLDCSATAAEGGELQVTWAVRNSGGDVSRPWCDSLHLSQDGVLDAGDALLGTFFAPNDLASSASYTQTQTIRLPAGTGDWKLILTTDSRSQAPEGREDNNVAVIDVATASALLPNLSAAGVSAPGTIVCGDTAAFSWTSSNTGQAVAAKPWRESVYLTQHRDWSGESYFVGAATSAGDSLAPGSGEPGAMAAEVAGAPPGDYYAAVKTDAWNRVSESDETDNDAFSENIVTVAAIPLAMDVQYQGTAPAGRSYYFELDVPAGEWFRLGVDHSGESAWTEVYLKRDGVASPSSCDFRSQAPGKPDQSVTVLESPGGRYSILVRFSGDCAGPFTVLANRIEFSIQDVQPRQAGNVGQITLKITGAKLESHQAFTLRNHATGAEVQAVWTGQLDAERVAATFDLTGAVPGVWDLMVEQSALDFTLDAAGNPSGAGVRVVDSSVFPAALTVVSGGGAQLVIQRSVPASVRARSIYPVTVSLSNAGNVDLPVPVVQIASPTSTPIWLPGRTQETGASQLQIIPVGSTRADVLTPGESVSVTLQARAPANGQTATFSFIDLSQPGVPVNWDEMEGYYSAGYSVNEWPTVWNGLKAVAGPNWDDLHNAMRRTIAERLIPTDSAVVLGSEAFAALLGLAAYGDAASVGPPQTATMAATVDGVAAPGAPTGSVHVLADGCSWTDLMADYTFGVILNESPCDRSYQAPCLDLMQSYLLNVFEPTYRYYYGNDVGNIFTDYVTGKGGNVLFDGRVTPNSKMLESFAGNPMTAIWTRWILSAAAGTIAARCPDTWLGGEEATNIPVNEVARALWPEVNYSDAFTQPGTLVGGVGDGDIRGCYGNLYLKATRACRGGPITGLRLTTQPPRGVPGLRLRVEDTYDLCTGDLGSRLESAAATWFMAALEGNGRARDVHLAFDFAAPWASVEIPTTGLPESCQAKCPTEPPGAECSQPCPGDCKEGKNSSSSSDDCDDGDGSGSSGAYDPNEKIGPVGYGPEHWVQGTGSLPYQVSFENVATATAPAAEVRITDQLDEKLDLTTFRLGDIHFGDTHITVPPDSASFETEVDLTATHFVKVKVKAGVDPLTRQAFWTMTSIDPATGDLPWDPSLGFLYPNDLNGRGQGFVTYTIAPLAGLPTGTEIRNKASIVFDYNEPIETNEVLNTLDSVAPSSVLAALPERVESAQIPLAWMGSDVNPGSGLKDFSIYVSRDGAAYEPCIANTADATGVFTGEPGHRYGFYVVARDNAGNIEDAPGVPDTETVVKYGPATNPNPANNAANVWRGAGLSWTPGEEATSHSVFLWRADDPKPSAPTATGLSNAFQPVGLLDPLTSYHWQVVAHSALGDAAGLVWTFHTEGAPSDANLPSARAQADGTAVELFGPVVTASFGGFFYVENADRSMGIRVDTAAPPPTGKRVNVKGTIETTPDGERYVEASEVAVRGDGWIRPLSIGSQTLGGGPAGYDPATGAGQRGLEAVRYLPSGDAAGAPSPMTGLNNIGLLVTLTGKVVRVQGGEFYLVDASTLGDGTARGVRVRMPAGSSLPPAESFVSVTGISSLYAEDGHVYRLLLAAGTDPVTRHTGGLLAAKQTPDGTSILITDLVVSGHFPGFFYAQDRDRSGGVRVVSGSAFPAVGTKITLIGTLGTTDQGERFIEASQIDATGSGTASPLQMTCRALGGADFLMDAPGQGQKGVRQGLGLNNIGLLVRLSGRVTSADAQGGFFTLWDNTSWTWPSVLTDGNDSPGVRVLAAPVPLPAVGQWVSVTGISSCYKAGDVLFPLVRVRSGADVQMQ